MTPPSESTSGLVELEKRLESASGPDRELDYALFERFNREWLDANHYTRDGDGYKSWRPPIEGSERIRGPEEFTGSVDAALALVERCIAKDELAAWDVGFAYNGGPYAARILTPIAEIEVTHEGSPALALCLALVRAAKASVP